MKIRQSSVPKLAPLLVASAFNVGCNLPSLNGDGENPSPDGTFTANQCQVAPLPDDAHLPELIPGAEYGNWKAVLLDDVVDGDEHFVCGDGSPYKFFVQYNEQASDLTVTLEGGGACFDYETCTGNAGQMQPYRLGGISDNMMTSLNSPIVALYPHLGRVDNGVPTNKYNHVFFPYCTADVYSGDIDKTYRKLDENGDEVLDEDGNPIEKTVRHRGRRNMLAAQDWLADKFGNGKTGQMLVIGHSAGATGTTVSYPLIRDSIEPKCSAGVIDSGPIFPAGGPQAQQVAIVKKAWALDQATGEPGDERPSFIEQLDQQLDTGSRTIKRDLANVSEALSRTFPNDRFLLAAFQEDLIFSNFSFLGSGVVQKEDSEEDIENGVTVADRLINMWRSELERFAQWAPEQKNQNWGYYFPVFRIDNCAHLVAGSPWSMQHDPAYRSAGIDGRAHGYLRTDLGDEEIYYDLGWDENHEAAYFEVTRRMHFGDALRQLLDPSQEIPRYFGEYIEGELTYQQPGTSDDTWYHDFQQPEGVSQVITDKQTHVAVRSLECASIGDYIQPEPYVQIPDEQRDVPVTIDEEGLFRISTGNQGIIQVAHPWKADVSVGVNEQEPLDLPYDWGGPIQLDPNTQYLVRVVTPSPMDVRVSWW